jgi:hypothetical protein
MYRAARCRLCVSTLTEWREDTRAVAWVGRDDVGSGVIKWRGGGDEKAIEILIGSDPKRAPSQLNKWGYLVEAMRGGESSVVGLISQENDDRLSDVKADLKTRKEQRAFDTIRGYAATAEGVARVGTLYAPRSPDLSRRRCGSG